jgi:DmsE family decaheme c-type cytochrome
MELKIICRFPAALCASLIFSSVASPQSSPDEAAVYSRNGADTCIACHDVPATMSIFRTKHAVPTDSRSPFGAGQLQCEACHGPGGAHSARVRRGQERPSVIRFGPDSEAAVSEQNELCLGCHDGNVGFAWHGSGHDDNEIACADCHQVHNTHDPVLSTASQPDVCFDCHRQQRSQALKAYSHPFNEGKMDCSGCHGPHGQTTERLLVRQNLNDNCFECHAEKRGPYLWEHAPAAEDCSNCHDPHGSNHPGMVSLRGPMLCQTCHSQADHQSFANGPDGLADGTASKYLLSRNCLNCHTQIHGSNHPSGSKLMR